MNSTNRALNRAVVLVVGLLTLLAGAALVAIATIPAIRDGYRVSAPTLHDDFTTWFRSVPLFDTNTSWGWILVLAALAVVVVLLVTLVARQGRGRHDTLLREETTAHGATVISAAVAQQAIQHDLDGRPEILASHVFACRVRRASVLKVSVTCRRGVSPRLAAHVVEDTLSALDTLLGRQLPALIQVSGGFRARLSPRARSASSRIRTDETPKQPHA
ncbi:hypothetical protein ACFOYW_04830 [Gryllotalpicola reticulitermitis]|uniref:Alkaline shock response membrane anchor protein AmaP n=1 Tax=Gryllotalpicola reticulitermitis TaxID=1184153 RepID=A0ABV8Q5N1_9MICO